MYDRLSPTSGEGFAGMELVYLLTLAMYKSEISEKCRERTARNATIYAGLAITQSEIRNGIDFVTYPIPRNEVASVAFPA